MIRRSFLYSPLIPIYGFASLFIIIIADIIGYNMWKIFIIGVIVSSVIEYFCSYFQEKVFKTKSWDYSEFKFNLNGRINLVYSIGFGLISMFIIKYIKMFAELVGDCCEYKIFLVITVLAVIILLIDTLVSTLACLRYNKRHEGVEASNKVDLFLDKKYPDSVVEKIYNNSIYVG